MDRFIQNAFNNKEVLEINNLEFKNKIELFSH